VCYSGVLVKPENRIVSVVSLPRNDGCNPLRDSGKNTGFGFLALAQLALAGEHISHSSAVGRRGCIDGVPLLAFELPGNILAQAIGVE
jgi:hypothetical protein